MNIYTVYIHVPYIFIYSQHGMHTGVLHCRWVVVPETTMACGNIIAPQSWVRSATMTKIRLDYTVPVDTCFLLCCWAVGCLSLRLYVAHAIASCTCSCIALL